MPQGAAKKLKEKEVVCVQTSAQRLAQSKHLMNRLLLLASAAKPARPGGLGRRCSALPLGPAAHQPPARGLVNTGALRALHLRAVPNAMEGTREGLARWLFIVANHGRSGSQRGAWVLPKPLEASLSRERPLVPSVGLT